MPTYDLNLLTALDILLAEGSVSRAARRMHLSNAAMSRTLGRIRDAFGDPILVRAGRSLVPTPRALELKDRLRPLLDEAEALRHKASEPDLQTLDRVFTISANEGFIVEYGGRLLEAISKDAPAARLCFVVKAQKDPKALREGRIDLEIGVLGDSGPEIRCQTLLRDRFVGVTGPDHELSSGGPVTAERYAAHRHISVSRRGVADGPIDDALRAIGLTREVAVIVPGFPGALALVRNTQFVANVPERQTLAARSGLFTFSLPFTTEPVVVSMMWHPRSDSDSAQRWFRSRVRDVCSN